MVRSVNHLCQLEFSKERKRNVYTYPSEEGRRTLTLKGNYFTGMVIEDNGYSTEIIRKLNPIEMILVFYPLILVELGGAIGGALGALAMITNASIMRKTENLLFKIIGSLVVGFIAYELYAYIATLIVS